jgi:hypothetical protein
MRFESNSCSPTLVDNRGVLEYCYSAKLHLVHSIQGTYEGDLERGMLNQLPTLDIIYSNWFQVRSPVDQGKFQFIHSVRDIITELCGLHHCESTAECFEMVDSLLADNQCLFPVAELVEGAVRGPNPMQRESKADTEWLASTLLPGGSDPAVYLHQLLSSGK